LFYLPSESGGLTNVDYDRPEGSRRSSSLRRSPHESRSALAASVQTEHAAIVRAWLKSSNGMRLPRDLMRLNRCGESKAQGPYPARADASWGIVEGDLAP
jgi:hypothetical protein